MREGAFEFLVKPLRLANVRELLERVFEDRRTREAAELAQQAAADAHRLSALVGRDPAMIEVYKRVGHLAATRVNALIRGETGTGKGVVARTIHYNSAEAAQPFISVNCTALPETLLELPHRTELHRRRIPQHGRDNALRRSGSVRGHGKPRAPGCLPHAHPPRPDTHRSLHARRVLHEARASDRLL
jgi:hypothetical protein